MDDKNNKVVEIDDLNKEAENEFVNEADMKKEPRAKGQPPKPPALKKTQKVYINLTMDEKSYFDELCVRMGISGSQLARQALMEQGYIPKPNLNLNLNQGKGDNVQNEKVKENNSNSGNSADDELKKLME